MLENVDQLIAKANLINDEEERVKYVMQYFFNTVEYNYAFFVACGYIRGDIRNFASNNICVNNPFKKGYVTIMHNGKPIEASDEFSYGSKAIGDSKLYNEILKLQNDMIGNEKGFYDSLEKILVEELLCHLDNRELVVKEINFLINKIKEEMNKGILRFSSSSGKYYYICDDISKILEKFIRDYNGKIYFPPIFRNGFIKRGVCQNYADYLVSFFSKIGIEAHRIDGTSEAAHSWVAVKVNGKIKSVDLTRAIFIRDRYKGIPKNQTPDMWLLSDFEDIFKMQSTRTISEYIVYENGEVKEIPFDYVIDGNNFSYELLLKIFNNYSNSKSDNK